MTLTQINRAKIDALSYKSLLQWWRFAPIGDSWFQGETGEYIANRLKELKADNPEAAAIASKEIGW